MTGLLAEVPDVNYKSGTMFSGWSVKARVILWLIFLGIYMYVLILFKTLYLKDESLNNISRGVKDMKQLIETVKSLDIQLAADLEHFEAARPNY